MTRNYGRVGVFCGGASQEREISLLTGKSVHAALLEEGVDATLVDVGHDEINFSDFDMAFIALHGRDGEDGKFQSVLEYHGVPYTGSNVQASNVSMNKWHTKAVWKSVGINTPDYCIVHRDIGLLCEDIDYPVYVKPVNEGSSIGISHVKKESGLDSAVNKAFEYDDFVLVEQAIEGQEYTCSYLEGRDDLPLIKLEPESDFYDYDAKYIRDDTGYIVAPDMDQSLAMYCKDQAARAFEVLGMSGWGRVDFIMDGADRPWFIEANSIPGMTSHSLVPMAAKHAGLDFGQLCLHILGTATNDK